MQKTDFIQNFLDQQQKLIWEKEIKRDFLKKKADGVDLETAKKIRVQIDALESEVELLNEYNAFVKSI